LLNQFKLDVTGKISGDHEVFLRDANDKSCFLQVETGEILKSLSHKAVEKACRQLAIRLVFIAHVLKALSPHSDGTLLGKIFLRRRASSDEDEDPAIKDRLKAELTRCKEFLIIPSGYYLAVVVEYVQ
jgi:hypothetical protein